MKTKEASRCHHVTTGGVQCGSPSLNKLRYCYYHQQGRSTAIKYYSEAPYTAVEEDLPLFEDAHSIQLAIRQIASLLMQRKIEPKAAGLLLYSIQLALLNLKQLRAEKPHPAQVVIDAKKFEETLPESAFVQTEPPNTDSEPSRKPPQSERKRRKEGEPTGEEVQEQLDYLIFLGKHLDEPADEFPNETQFIRMDRALREGALGNVGEMMQKFPKEKLPEALKEAKEIAEAKANAKDGFPPGTIQGCAASCAIRRPRSERRSERRPERRQMNGRSTENPHPNVANFASQDGAISSQP